MNRLLSIMMALLLAASLTACGGASSAPVSAPPESESSAVQVPKMQDGLLEVQLEHICQLLEDNGVTPNETGFDYQYSIYLTDHYTVYISDGMYGVKGILTEWEGGSSYTLCPHTNIFSVGETEDGMLQFYTDGSIHGGDRMLNNFDGFYTMDPKTGDILETHYVGIHPEGTYGQYCGMDGKYHFGNCSVEDDTVTFRFDPVDPVIGLSCTEIFFAGDPYYQEGDRTARIYFHRTSPEPEGLEEKMEQIPGILDVEFSEEDEDFFEGTSMEIRYEENYVLYYQFGTEPMELEIQDFTIQCVPFE